MRILIIGGTGLISTAITRDLLTRGEDVWMYNRGQTSTYSIPPEGAHVVAGDRQRYTAFEQQIADLGRFDCVIDMICYLPQDAESAVRAFSSRTDQYMFCSTVDVYRKPATRYPYAEDEPYGGLNAYSTNKVRCEQILRRAHEYGDLPVTIIRPGYTYGEGRSPANTWGLGSAYIDRLRKGKPVVVHGDGSSFWTACHRDDVGAAFANAAGNARTVGRAYHVPGETWMTWNDYHRIVAEAIGAAEPTLVHIPTDVLGAVAPARARISVENFQFSNIFDTSSARKDLDFADRVRWREGVRRMVRWLDDHDGIQNSDLDPFEDRLVDAWRRLGSDLVEAADSLERV
ncbi:MAG: NAD-dependent epimerase/dehydratase family protein [Chloroflexi bacterium]|nr:NAD-dependent epimerase/dehydratase family protein [Chloroflexota bacterium]